MPVKLIPSPCATMQEIFLHQTRLLAAPSGFCVRTSPLTAAAWVQGAGLWLGRQPLCHRK